MDGEIPIMTLDNDRIDKIFWLFGNILPIPQDDAKRKALEAIVGGKLQTIIPQFMHMLSIMMKQNHEVSEMWIEFFSQSLDYIQCISDESPQVDLPQGEIDKIWKVYAINHRNKKKEN